MKDVSKERSAVMRAVKSRGTKPELEVRRLVHDLGYRYVLCRKELPGCPDIVITRLKKVLFVHGCFWHGHHCRRGSRTPKSNTNYWVQKVEKNKARERTALRKLRGMGWEFIKIWECQLRNPVTVQKRLKAFLCDQ